MKNDSTENEAPRDEWRRLSRLWPYLWEHRVRVAVALVFLIGAKGATVLLPIVLKHIVDALDANESARVALPVVLLLAYGALRLASVLFGQLRDLVFGRVTERAMRRIALTCPSMRRSRASNFFWALGSLKCFTVPPPL